MAGIWLCTDCHSANRDGAKRCYKCRTPRSAGEMRDATVAIATDRAQQATANLAAAARKGARYRPSWVLAAIFVPLSVLNIVVTFMIFDAEAPLISAAGEIVGSKLEMDQVAILGLWNIGASLVGTLVWALWIALVVSNVPALTARWPKHDSLGAFMAVWYPVHNLWRPYKVVRDVLRILADGPGPALIATAWWLTLLAATLGWLFVILYAVMAGATQVRPIILLAFGTRIFFLILTGVLGAIVVVIVERAQRRAAARRSAIVLLAEQAPSG